jgi:hypothetical protein
MNVTGNGERLGKGRSERVVSKTLTGSERAGALRDQPDGCALPTWHDAFFTLGDRPVTDLAFSTP